MSDDGSVTAVALALLRSEATHNSVQAQRNT